MLVADLTNLFLFHMKLPQRQNLQIDEQGDLRAFTQFNPEQLADEMFDY